MGKDVCIWFTDSTVVVLETCIALPLPQLKSSLGLRLNLHESCSLTNVHRLTKKLRNLNQGSN